MYADGADQPFHSLPDLIGDKYVLEMNNLTEVVLKGAVLTLYLIWILKSMHVYVEQKPLLIQKRSICTLQSLRNWSFSFWYFYHLRVSLCSNHLLWAVRKKIELKPLLWNVCIIMSYCFRFCESVSCVCSLWLPFGMFSSLVWFFKKLKMLFEEQSTSQQP